MADLTSPHAACTGGPGVWTGAAAFALRCEFSSSTSAQCCSRLTRGLREAYELATGRPNSQTASRRLTDDDAGRRSRAARVSTVNTRLRLSGLAAGWRAAASQSQSLSRRSANTVPPVPPVPPVSHRASVAAGRRSATTMPPRCHQCRRCPSALSQHATVSSACVACQRQQVRRQQA